MKQYIFLASSSYSGSTLLALILGSHPLIATVSELIGVTENTDFNSYMCSCGNKLANCDFWSVIADEMIAKFPDFNLRNFQTRFQPISGRFIDKLQFAYVPNRRAQSLRNAIYHFSPKHRKHLNNIIERNISLGESICRYFQKDYFLDASKNYLRIHHLKRNLKCPFKVIHLIKDGRGVFNSYKRYQPSLSDQGAILKWKSANIRIENALTEIEAENHFRLLYRDLANDTERTLQKLFNFIGLDFSPNCLNFQNQKHHIIGNTNTRLNKSNEIYYDEKWKDSLSASQLALFNKIGGDLNKKYGYR